MTDLLSQLERATEGSRELSDDMLRACGWRTEGIPDPVSGVSALHWFAPSHIDWPDTDWGKLRLPDPTRNLQDAVSLVLEGMEFELTNLYGVARVAMGLNVSDAGPWYGERLDGDLPLALCIAIIKAHESKAEAA